MEHGEAALDASLHSAKEISFTILSMTISLAAVFLPLVFMPGLVGRIFREFAVTIIVSIFASGVVSLTLTPLMCSRLLAARGHGAKTHLDGTRHRRRRTTACWTSTARRSPGSSGIAGSRLLIWIVCLVGTVWLFMIVPKSFLPIGDSSFISAAHRPRRLVAADQMHALPGPGPKTVLHGRSDRGT